MRAVHSCNSWLLLLSSSKIIMINFYIVIIVAITVGKSYSHQDKGVKNYKSELTINTLVH